jgi:hypothetical protein
MATQKVVKVPFVNEPPHSLFPAGQMAFFVFVSNKS